MDKHWANERQTRSPIFTSSPTDSSSEESSMDMGRLVEKQVRAVLYEQFRKIMAAMADILANGIDQSKNEKN